MCRVGSWPAERVRPAERVGSPCMGVPVRVRRRVPGRVWLHHRVLLRRVAVAVTMTVAVAVAVRVRVDAAVTAARIGAPATPRASPWMGRRIGR